MKKILISLIAVVFIVPQVAMAAWWNPLSWFEGVETGTIVQDDNVINKDNGNNVPTEESKRKIPVDSTISNKVTAEVSATKQGTSNRNYDNEISRLQQEVQAMKASIDSLKKSNENLLATLNNQTRTGVSNEKLIGRIDGLEKHADSMSGVLEGLNTRFSKIESQPKAQNYDSQIKEMSRYINALISASTLNDGALLCGSYALVSEKDSYPACSSVYKSLSF